MLEIIKLGGWMMLPIIVCSILAMAIIGERLWSLRARRIMPPDLIPKVFDLHRNARLDAVELRNLKIGSPLGAIVAAALSGQPRGHEAMKETVEQAGRQVVHELERYLNTLGTIASVSPYLGLLGSVLGMMKVFATFSAGGSEIANPARLAGGISEILIATAAGLAVAIPSLIFYRYFQGKVAELTVRMEEEAVQMIEALSIAPQDRLQEPP
ncbi:MAG: MotA/TolQ/ExbB proton channel family protein [Methylococcaceae bacterium]|nr:MotA/TolQ/ExbB proton channel family protein [Methylococcaceae bacterium]